MSIQQINSYYGHLQQSDKGDACAFCKQHFLNDKKVTKRDSLSLDDLDTISEDPSALTQVKCNHVYHAHCLIGWVRFKIEQSGKPVCSLCNDVLLKEHIVKPVEYDVKPVTCDKQLPWRGPELYASDY